MYPNNVLRDLPIYVCDDIYLNEKNELVKGNHFFEVHEENNQYVVV